jgi:Domain of unknown function (DUF4149)
MAGRVDQLMRLVPGVWAGLLLCVALIATPAPFATLAVQDAGRVVGWIFAREAPISLALGLVLLIWERRSARSRADQGQGSQLSADMLLALGAIFCTVAGYYGLQPLMAAARAGQEGLTFGQLHAASLGLFGLKLLLVFVLAWRSAQRVA